MAIEYKYLSVNWRKMYSHLSKKSILVNHLNLILKISPIGGQGLIIFNFGMFTSKFRDYITDYVYIGLLNDV